MEEKLKKMGLFLPNASSPGGKYVSVNIRGTIGYVAIQFPIIENKYFYLGRLGAEVNTRDGYQAMQFCALNVLSQIKKHVDMDNFIGLNHIDAYYQGSKGWDDAPKVVDGASELFLEILGEKGQHARAIFGVESLPRNFSVGLTASFTFKKRGRSQGE
ncbi:RidA family protein [Algoriphagus sp. CAU 1675]|uniref:RidA family protein n=1 Tax=Algoriphagus sp. CAU 1675 TaxID=3032597 RepID=UPI0023DB1D67|nr:RidA family protein [Algoriphagus sp. CAU 1675]MDF2159378.1 RidA family protein [Algoriphagus sp. CAU 1675]